MKTQSQQVIRDSSEIRDTTRDFATSQMLMTVINTQLVVQ